MARSDAKLCNILVFLKYESGSNCTIFCYLLISAATSYHLLFGGLLCRIALVKCKMCLSHLLAYLSVWSRDFIETQLDDSQPDELDNILQSDSVISFMLGLLAASFLTQHCINLAMVINKFNGQFS